MPAPVSYDYAVIRVVPRVEREEFINAGVVLFSKGCHLLAARVAVDEARLRALAAEVDLDLVRRHLEAIPRICAGARGRRARRTIAATRSPISAESARCLLENHRAAVSDP